VALKTRKGEGWRRIADFKIKFWTLKRKGREEGEEDRYL
jgi:hypothetical protein